ncbi:hypothetical protein EDD22DRAFT_358466 [Suillus occidentalis]|nr:hypothetical protein EDD22DRAFT_358466 [Suillus occidentalis]
MYAVCFSSAVNVLALQLFHDGYQAMFQEYAFLSCCKSLLMAHPNMYLRAVFNSSSSLSSPRICTSISGIQTGAHTALAPSCVFHCQRFHPQAVQFDVQRRSKFHDVVFELYEVTSRFGSSMRLRVQFLLWTEGDLDGLQVDMLNIDRHRSFITSSGRCMYQKPCLVAVCTCVCTV